MEAVFPVAMGHAGPAALHLPCVCRKGPCCLPWSTSVCEGPCLLAVVSLSLAPQPTSPLYHVLVPSEGGCFPNCQKQDPGPSTSGEEGTGVLGEQR